MGEWQTARANKRVGSDRLEGVQSVIIEGAVVVNTERERPRRHPMSVLSRCGGQAERAKEDGSDGQERIGVVGGRGEELGADVATSGKKGEAAFAYGEEGRDDVDEIASEVVECDRCCCGRCGGGQVRQRSHDDAVMVALGSESERDGERRSNRKDELQSGIDAEKRQMGGMIVVVVNAVQGDAAMVI